MFKYLSLVIASIILISAGTGSNVWSVGDGNPGIGKEIRFNVGNGASNPAIKFDTGSSKIQIANDGVTFEEIISNDGNLTTEDGLTSLDVSLGTGNASAGDSGDVTIQTGSATGTRGKIKLVDGSEGTIGHVWTSTGVDGSGAWAAPSGGGGGPTPWRSGLVAALTNDLVSPGSGIDATAWSDNDDRFDVQVGQYIIGDGDGSPSLFEITSATPNAGIYVEQLTGLSSPFVPSSDSNITAQTFQISNSGAVDKVTVNIFNGGGFTGGNIFAEIQETTAGQPNGSILGTSDSYSILGVNGFQSFIFPTPVNLVSGTTYAVLIRTSGMSGGGLYAVRASLTNPYADGQLYVTVNGGSTWTSQPNNDIYFRLERRLLVDLSSTPMQNGDVYSVNHYLPYPTTLEDPATVRFIDSGSPVVKLTTLTRKETKSLAGQGTLTSGSCTFTRVEYQVTTSCTSASHPPASSVSTFSEFAPSWARPSTAANNYGVVNAFVAGVNVRYFRIGSSGQLTWQYVNWSGTATSFGSSSPASISYSLE